MDRQTLTLDGNEAAARVAYKTSEVIAIYPITPSSPMGEWADQWAADGDPNLWGAVPVVQEMQSEGGAAGAVHGALQTGALTTTFTASQGLLLMIPNMYKIAGELTSAVFHIAARSVAAQALSIFGDHSDVMATRATGWGMLFSSSVQEVSDMALIAHAATLRARVPFLHVFDGFRTSHEVMKIETLGDDDLRALIDDDLVRAHRMRRLSPDHPFIRGTAQNPDAFFQAREGVNPFYEAVPGMVQAAMDALGARTGRAYHLFDYVGHPEAERVVVLMGSGSDAAEETVTALAARGERVGAVKVRLYRPFDGAALIDALPATVQGVAVLDRTKEPGAAGEPLYKDVVTALAEGVAAGTLPALPKVVGGRYGLSSKEFTPAMVAAVLENLRRDPPKNHFTVGIEDDVGHTSLEVDPAFDVEHDDVFRGVFWGLGSDGTVGANKNAVKIIGELSPLFAQGYFVYDSRKAGARTISNLRFSPRPIKSPYLPKRASFVACHQFDFLETYDVLGQADAGATFLLNSPYGPDEVWPRLPGHVRHTIRERGLKLWVIDATRIAQDLGLGGRINTVLAGCFFALTNVVPADAAFAAMRTAIEKTYGKGGDIVIRRNFAALDAAREHMQEVTVPATDDLAEVGAPPTDRFAGAPDFVRDVTARLLAGEGDQLPVSAFPVDGTYPSGTTQYEKRNLAPEVPVWAPDICIQCGKCVLVCPHAVIRAKIVPDAELTGSDLPSLPAQFKDLPDHQYVLAVSVEDCTGCQLCVEVCPAKDKSNVGRKALNMEPQRPLRESGAATWAVFDALPETPRGALPFKTVRDVQFLEPLFEFSGACSGCGETPYVKLMTQLFGDRAIVANATGCSSIYGGNLPTTPWSFNSAGRGPAWSNSLFEDNAEFGLGMRLTLDNQEAYARELLERLRDELGGAVVDPLLAAGGSMEDRRAAVEALQAALAGRDDPASRDLASLAEVLVPRSVWLVGGDGWAYDIGYGGLDHVLASGRNVNVLVLDTEVYSNTGGQASKATPLSAVAKFAAAGKPTPKKDLGLMAMAYGSVYVAQVAMGGSDSQTVRAFLEAESYPGPSLIIAYSHCIAHGIDMTKGLEQQKRAVESGYWPLFRFDPRRTEEGLNPFQLDSHAPRIKLSDYAAGENRFRMLARRDPARSALLMAEAQAVVKERWAKYERMAAEPVATAGGGQSAAVAELGASPPGSGPPSAGASETSPPASRPPSAGASGGDHG